MLLVLLLPLSAILLVCLVELVKSCQLVDLEVLKRLCSHVEWV